MKLCIIANPNSAHTRRWINQFASRGHEMHLIGEHTLQGDLPDNCTFHDLTLQSEMPKLRYIAWVQSVRRLVRSIRPDIVHALGITSAGWLGAACGFKPFLATALGSDLLLMHKRSMLHRRLNIWVLRRATYITCQSIGLGEKAAALGVPGHKFEVALFGVETSLFKPSPQQLESMSKQNHHAGPMVLSIRAMTKIYNPLDIARAIPKVLTDHPSTLFAIQTYNQDPQLYEQFQKIIKASGVEDSVTYIGDLADDHAIAACYASADLALSVPSSDGTPISVLEAMSCAVPVIAYDIPAAKPWIHPGETGLLVPLGDVDALASAVSRLLSDPRLRAQMGENARRLILENADTRECMDHYEVIYRCLVNGQPLK